MTYSLYFKRKGEEYNYRLSNKDILNLLRAVAHEGKPYNGVTWSLLMRFAWLYPSGNYDTLSEFVKAYAQPINPRWFPDGDKHKAHIRYLKRRFSGDKLQELIDEAEDRAERRVDYSNQELDEIDDKYKNVVYKILKGTESNPIIGAVHYIASRAPRGATENQAKQAQKEYAEKYNHVNKPVFYDSSKLGNNWFFNVRGSEKFNVIPYEDYEPEIVIPGTKTKPESDAIALVFILSGAAVAKLLKEIDKKNV